uniref:Uncharacterized protein n=1 Tax=Arundo donax TaxID=35708 RepID=A0A0A9C583_ARUDO
MVPQFFSGMMFGTTIFLENKCLDFTPLPKIKMYL